LRVGEQSYGEPHDRSIGDDGSLGDRRPVRDHGAAPDHRGCGDGSAHLPDDGAG